MSPMISPWPPMKTPREKKKLKDINRWRSGSPSREPYFLAYREKHRFHLVDHSNLPFVTACAVFFLVGSFVYCFHPVSMAHIGNLIFVIAGFSFCFIITVWFYVVLAESNAGYHLPRVRRGLRYGFALFIVSEIMFFFAFFWAFFHVSVAPAVAVGFVWPPKSVQVLDYTDIPLTNTLLLLTSGLCTTWAHKCLWSTDDHVRTTLFGRYLLLAITLGITFLLCQWLEYKYGTSFGWKENVYGSTFFVATAFHGLHVTIGTVFLIFCYFRYRYGVNKAIERFFGEQVDREIKAAIKEERKRKKKQLREERLAKFNKFRDDYIAWAEGLRDRETMFGRLAYFVLTVPYYILEALGIGLHTIVVFLNGFYKKFLALIERIKEFLRKGFLLRLMGAFSDYNKSHHFSFEAAAWYWHFVDVVWLFLFLTIYWWGSA